MTAPKGVSIGAEWTRKRGKARAELPAQVVVANIYRADGECLIYVPARDAHAVVGWTALKRDYNPPA